MLAPTPEGIESKALVETGELEFKQQIDLDEPRGKSNLVDDVVAFLNAGPGHIVVGVREKGGVWERFVPMNGDADVATRRVLSILQDNIDPRPLRVDVRPIPLREGFLLDIDIPEHSRRPYQNRLNGAFYLRTGPKNTPLTRDEVASMFVAAEAHERDALRRLGEEEANLAARGIMVSEGPSLEVGILPRESYDRGQALFAPGGARPVAAYLFHNRQAQLFRGCDGGHEAAEIDFHDRGISRLFVGSDWFIHSHVDHAFNCGASGRLRLPEFKEQLTNHLVDLGEFLEGQKLRGPFGVALGVRNLQRSTNVGFFFPNCNAVGLARAAVVERVDDLGLIDQFYNQVVGASRFG
ncbi:helix-turn-helix domain-containing protein [Phenylobacterium sp.]|uniref:AlbA family DNA-binding domain-containing protein n=1 Tax=Phenylobacterium sp. TaxID=1871053 RepID=UPI0035B26883